MANRFNRRDFMREQQDRERDWARGYAQGADRDYDRYYNRGFTANRDYSRRDYQTTHPYSGRDYSDPYYQRQDYRSFYDSDFDSNWNSSRSPAWTNTEDWRIPGPYTGMGPSGYQRTDERIHEEVHNHLTRHGRIDARQISIQVQNGEVILTGIVNSKQEKRLAEDIVENVFGVRNVQNDLRVERSNQDWHAQNSSFQGGQIREGMNVGDQAGTFLGTVKEIRGQEFLLDRPMARDLWVPMHTCSISGGQVILDVKAEAIDQQGWRPPELV